MRIPVEEMEQIVNDVIFSIRRGTMSNRIYIPQIDFTHFQEAFMNRGFTIIVDGECTVTDNDVEEPGLKCHLIPYRVDRMEWDFI